MIMVRTLGGHGLHVLDGCDPVLRGRHAREGLEVAVEVRLVVVAAVERRVGQLGAVAQVLGGALEAQDAGERLGREADVLAEARGEMAPAPPDLLRQ
jgi:hypothetical protein